MKLVPILVLMLLFSNSCSSVKQIPSQQLDINKFCQTSQSTDLTPYAKNVFPFGRIDIVNDLFTQSDVRNYIPTLNENELPTATDLFNEYMTLLNVSEKEVLEENRDTLLFFVKDANVSPIEYMKEQILNQTSNYLDGITALVVQDLLQNKITQAESEQIACQVYKELSVLENRSVEFFHDKHFDVHGFINGNIAYLIDEKYCKAVSGKFRNAVLEYRNKDKSTRCEPPYLIVD